MLSFSHSKFIFLFIVYVVLSNGSVAVAKKQTTNIGVLIDESTRAGKEQKTAIEIAVQKLNSGSKVHMLAVHYRNCSGDPLEAASSANELIEKQNVLVIIIGTNSWEETTLVAKIGQRGRVPVISLTTATLQPLSHLQWPFLVQMTDVDIFNEIKCITSLIKEYHWKRIIAVYEDNVYGGEYEGFSLLSEALQNIDTVIEHRLVVPHFTSPFDQKETIRENLATVLTTKQSRVFILLKSSLPTATLLFEEAKKLGLTGQDSVWILGNRFSSLLDSIDPSVFQPMNGALGIKTYYSDKSPGFLEFRSNFKTIFRSNYPGEDRFEPEIFAIRAYDSVETVWRALDQLGNPNNTHGGFPEKLLDTILSSNFIGLSSTISFRDGKLSEHHVLQLVNIVGKSYQELNFWSPRSGFSINIKQLSVIWPGHLINRIPRGWAMPNNATKMKIGVPISTIFKRFVNVKWIESTNETIYDGFCVAVFRAVVSTLEKKYGYTLPYEFVNHTGSYDSLIDKVYDKTYDAVVGDVTILANRSKFVDFTHAFMESGLSMVVPVKSESQTPWRFLRPFTLQMWLASAGILFYTMFVVWFMEHHVNPEFRGPWKDQLGTALWFTFNSLFFSHRETIRSNHSKMVVIIWMFVVFILTSSYTASLTTMLTVRILEPTVKDIDFIRRNNEPVACDIDTFVGKYLIDVLNVKNIKNVISQEEYPKNFENGNITAAFFELPYQKFFLKENCDKYMAVGPSYRSGGFGFVFPKDSLITDDVSEAILSLLEQGETLELEKQWLDTSQNCSSLNTEILSLNSFWGIFLVSGATSTLSLLIFLYRSRWKKNETRLRRAIKLVQIVLSLTSSRVVPSIENLEYTREHNTRNPRPTETGRPTQVELPVRKTEHIAEHL